ncbi:MAG: hypothetical protein U0271_08575 [Polyangiaceae bacterium]
MRTQKSWWRHFEGWQAGAVAVFVGGLVTAVLVPRSAMPEAIPPPSLSRAEAEGARERVRRLAAQAVTDGLGRDAQLFGARLRVVGRAEHDHDERQLQRATNALDDVAVRAVRNPADLAALRAYQALAFTKAYATYLRTGEESDDLIELGGDALDVFRDSGWFQDPATLPPDYDLVLLALYERRFARFAPSNAPELSGDPIEQRALIRFLLANPPDEELTREAGEVEAQNGTFMLRQLDALAPLDPSYPTLYAKGIIFFKMGHYEAAASAFDAYVRNFPDGPYRLRAVNYLKTAVEHANGAQ